MRTGRTSRWQGDRTQSTVWAIPNRNPFGGHATGADADTGHATQKPVALFEIPIRNHTEPGEAIYDPFAGCASTIIGSRLSFSAWVFFNDMCASSKRLFCPGKSGRVDYAARRCPCRLRRSWR